MQSFNQDAFDSFVLEHRVIGFFERPVTLKSGRTSNWYVNWRSVSEDAFLLRQLSGFLSAFVAGLVSQNILPRQPDTLFGVPEGATKVALFAQMQLAQASPSFAAGSHVLSMGRGKPKEHGIPKDKYFLGVPRGLTVVVEDVTTTGGSLVSSLGMLREADIECPVAVGLTNRMERRDDGKSVAEALKELSPPVRYVQLSDAIRLLPKAAKIQKPPSSVLHEIEKEFAEVGILPLTFS